MQQLLEEGGFNPVPQMHTAKKRKIEAAWKPFKRGDVISVSMHPKGRFKVYNVKSRGGAFNKNKGTTIQSSKLKGRYGIIAKNSPDPHGVLLHIKCIIGGITIDIPKKYLNHVSTYEKLLPGYRTKDLLPPLDV